MVTRETFATLAGWEIVLFYLLSLVTLVVFSFGAYRLLRKYLAGRGNTKLDGLMLRAGETVRDVLTQSRIRRRDHWAGFGHLAIVYGFVALTITSGILMINDDFLKLLFGLDVWRGDVYLAYSFLADVFGAALVAGLLVMAGRRLRRPARYDYARPAGTAGSFDRRRYVVGDWTFLGLLLFVSATGFLLEALRIAVTNPGYEVWSIVGWLLSRGIRALGADAVTPTTDAIRDALWWIHALAALATVAAIPYTKALHMLTSPMGLFVKDRDAGLVLPGLPPDVAADEVGYSRLVDFSPGHLLSLDACTRCGLCHVACPALASGLPLSPRDLILDLREAAEGAIGIRAGLRVPPLFDAARSILSDPIRAETLWSCTTCLACVEACPVGIEHVSIVVRLRRRLVEMGDLDTELQSTLRSVASSGNSFGEQRRRRSHWAKGLPVPLKDARRGRVEILWYVGDYASFDPRAQQATFTLARILQQAGVDVGILYEAENTAGCDVRRAGEEGLFTMLAQESLASLRACDFARILSSDPHTFHTLSREYPAFGLSRPVIHHSQLLLELLQRGAIRPRRSLVHTVTYHDPCYLGRYGGVYDAPREVLGALGVTLREMPRNREDSFCCGAGGGVIWMKDAKRAGDARRPAEQRVEEALGLPGVDRLIVACPKDLSMFTAAVTTLGCEDRLAVMDLSELVAEAVDLDGVSAAGVRRAPADASSVGRPGGEDDAVTV